MGMRVPGQLPDDVEEPEKNQRAAGQAREPDSDALAQGEAEPRHNEPEQRRKRRMPAGRERSDGERLGAAPPLRARGQDEREPVRRNGRVKKRDAESGNGDGGENGVVHANSLTGYADSHGFREEKKICENGSANLWQNQGARSIGLQGFEPWTSCTRGRRSTKLSHSPNSGGSNLPAPGPAAAQRPYFAQFDPAGK